MSRGLFWLDRIERLANLRGLSLEELIDSLEMHRGDFEDQCISRQGPGIQLLRKVTDSFEITIDDFLTGKFNEEWIRSPSLADQFVAENGSLFRTSLPVLRWLEKEHGVALPKTLLRSLRIPREFLNQPKRPVKLRLLYSILREAALRGLPEEAFFDMGVDAFEIPENENVRQQLAAIRAPQEIYEWFFSEAIVQFESNYTYRIHRSRPDSIILELTPKEGRIEENGAYVMSNRLLSIYRWGIAAGLIRWMGRPVAHARPVRLASRESPAEQFEVRWENSRHASLRDFSEGSSSKSRVPSLRLV